MSNRPLISFSPAKVTTKGVTEDPPLFLPPSAAFFGQPLVNHRDLWHLEMLIQQPKMGDVPSRND